LKTVEAIRDASKRLCWSCKNHLAKNMFKYTDWLISDKLINCVACVAKKARDDSGIKPLYVEVDPTKLAGITYTGTQMMHKEPDDFVTFREKKSDKAAKERDTFNYHSEVNAGQAAFMFQAQFGDKPYRLDPNSDETMDENSIRELIREVGGNPITSGRTKAFNSKTELRVQLEHLVYRPCIDYRDDRLEVLEIHDQANPASLFSSESKPCYGLFLKKTANPVKKGTVLGEYAGLVQDKHRLTNTLSNVKDEDEENEKDDISLMDEEYLMTLQTTVDPKYYNTIKKGSYAVVNARVYRNEMGFINDFRGIQEIGHDKRTGDRQKNIEFRDVVIDNWPRLFGTAVGDINPGDEILVDYGEHYWNVQEGMRQDHLRMNSKIERAKWVGELKEMSRSIKMLEGLLDISASAELKQKIEDKQQKLKHHQETLMKQANISNISQLSKLENSLTGKSKTA